MRGRGICISNYFKQNSFPRSTASNDRAKLHNMSHAFGFCGDESIKRKMCNVIASFPSSGNRFITLTLLNRC